MGKIKVLAFIVGMNDGGAQQVLLDNAIRLQNDDEIDFSVCTIYKFKQISKYEKELIANGILNTYLVSFFHRIIFKFFPSKKQKIIIKLCKKTINKIKPDAVHVHLAEAMLYIPQAADDCNVPVRFYSLHSTPYRQEGQVLESIKYAFLNQKFIAICLNNRQYRQANEYYNVQKYEILRNGIDFDYIRQNKISKEKARKQFGLNDSDFVISCVGRLAPVKNYSFMLDVMKIVVSKKQNAKLVFAGDGEEKEKLETKAQTLGIRENVVFLGNLSNVTPVYCASDVFCLTSVTEASSLVLLEAQAVNLHSVISAGVPSESIISDKVCQMQEKATAEEWADAVLNNSFVGKPVCTEEECDVNNATKNLKVIYKKYYEETTK